MPAAQGEVANREVRFTLRFRRTITIAARSVSLVAVSDTEFASNDALGATGGSETADTCERSISIGGRLWRRTSDAWAIGAPRRKRRSGGQRSGKESFPGTRASANTSGPDFNRTLGPVKLRSKDSAPNEENLFLLPDRLEERALPKVDPAV